MAFDGIIRRCLPVIACIVVVGCNLVPLNGPMPERREQGLPAKYSVRQGQFVFLSDFELPRSQPIFKDLATLGEQVERELQLPPSSNLVQVYLFEDREKYERFMQLKYPNLPKRRAFFVQQPPRMGGNDDLLVYTYWGDRIEQDLRHEMTHALLHSVLKRVPLWLDEGLAEYFEMPPGWNGVNYQHLEMLRRGGQSRPTLDRLEHLSDDDVQQMTPAEYREAWAWVHLLLQGSPQGRQVLITYLHELRTNSAPGSLQARLTRVFPAPETALESHLAELDMNK